MLPLVENSNLVGITSLALGGLAMLVVASLTQRSHPPRPLDFSENGVVQWTSKLGNLCGNSSLSPPASSFTALSIAVAYKAFGDVAQMIRNMAAGRGGQRIRRGLPARVTQRTLLGVALGVPVGRAVPRRGAVCRGSSRGPESPFAIKTEPKGKNTQWKPWARARPFSTTIATDGSTCTLSTVPGRARSTATRVPVSSPMQPTIADVANSGYGLGCAAADYDSDGDLDLYITAYGPNILYRNEGTGQFADVTNHTGVAGPTLVNPAMSTGAAFADYDLDGDLDFFVANYAKFRPEIHEPCLRSGVAVYCGPEAFEPQRDVFLSQRRRRDFCRCHRGSRVATRCCQGIRSLFHRLRHRRRPRPIRGRRPHPQLALPQRWRPLCRDRRFGRGRL